MEGLNLYSQKLKLGVTVTIPVTECTKTASATARRDATTLCAQVGAQVLDALQELPLLLALLLPCSRALRHPPASAHFEYIMARYI